MNTHGLADSLRGSSIKIGTTQKISMAPAQVWHAQIKKCKQLRLAACNFPASAKWVLTTVSKIREQKYMYEYAQSAY